MSRLCERWPSGGVLTAQRSSHRGRVETGMGMGSPIAEDALASGGD